MKIFKRDTFCSTILLTIWFAFCWLLFDLKIFYSPGEGSNAYKPILSGRDAENMAILMALGGFIFYCYLIRKDLKKRKLTIDNNKKITEEKRKNYNKKMREYFRNEIICKNTFFGWGFIRMRGAYSNGGLN